MWAWRYEGTELVSLGVPDFSSTSSEDEREDEEGVLNATFLPSAKEVMLTLAGRKLICRLFTGSTADNTYYTQTVAVKYFFHE